MTYTLKWEQSPVINNLTMLQSFPSLCSRELALGERSLNGDSAGLTFLLTPMLRKKREVSCRSQTAKISSGEVISQPVGCSLD